MCFWKILAFNNKLWLLFLQDWQKKNQSSDWQYFFSVFPWPFFSTWCLWIKIVLFNWLLLFKHYNLITVFLKFSCIYLYNDRRGRKWFDSLHCVLKNLKILGLPFEESYLKFESSPINVSYALSHNSTVLSLY